MERKSWQREKNMIEKVGLMVSFCARYDQGMHNKRKRLTTWAGSGCGGINCASVTFR
jgi:hypothetical protein